MIILSSPAKTQDFETAWDSIVKTNPQFLDESEFLVKYLRALSKSDLAKILHMSPQLADLNYKRYQEWKKSPAKNKAKPAVLAYNGDIFKQMQPTLYTKDQQGYAQQSLRIITGLYGLLRPYDLIQPYRLEMNAHLGINGSKNLYDFWSETLNKSLKKDLEKDSLPLLINCASQEYAKAINFSEIAFPWWTVEFKQKRKNKIENVGILAKKARGMMIEHLIRMRGSDLEAVKAFHTNGYELYSQNDHELVFVRSAD